MNIGNFHMTLVLHTTPNCKLQTRKPQTVYSVRISACDKTRNFNDSKDSSLNEK